MINDKYLPSSHFRELFSVSLLDNVRDVIIQLAWRKSVADCEECIHPVRSLVDLWSAQGSERRNPLPDQELQSKYLIVLVTPGVVLSHTENEVENRDKCTGSVGISPEHDVAEPDIVVSGNMAGCHPGEGRLLVELDVLHNLQGEGEVTEKTVNTQETDDTEVSEHAVQWANTILANDLTVLVDF